MKFVKIIMRWYIPAVAIISLSIYLILVNTDPKQQNIVPYKVACIGDSITADGGYIERLKELCPSNYIFYNYGVSGESTTQIVQRLCDSIIKTNYDVAIILAGVNNIANCDKVTNDLQFMCMSLRMLNPNIKIIVCTLTPWAGYKTWTMQKEINTEEINNWILSKPKYVGVAIDVFHPLAISGFLKFDYDSGDGLHPNALGQIKIGELIYASAFKR